jgi:cytochrome P450
MVLAILTIVIVILTGIYLWAMEKKKQMERAAATPPFEGIPLAPGAHWFFGHLGQMNKDGDFQKGQKTVLVDSANEDGIVSFKFLTTPAVSILLGKDAKAILNASSYRQPISFLKIHNDVFLGPYALTALMGKEWKYYRTVVHRSFTPAALRSSQEAINLIGSTLAKSLLHACSQNAGSYQATVLPVMKMATIDVFGLAVLGQDFECSANLKPSPIASAFDYLADEYTRRLARPWDPSARCYWLPTAANRRHKRERMFVRSFVAKLVAEKRLHPSSEKKDLLTSLVKANEEKGGEMSDAVLADTLMVLLFGGYDTTSITLTYALYLLATHADIQAQCVAEIKSILGTENSLKDPADLPYTRAVVLETLRLYPAAPVTTRNLEKPLEIRPGVVLPLGTMCYVPIWSIQRDERNYPQPQDFRPDRWVKKSAGETWIERFPNENDDMADIAAANRDAFCAFSGGARNCVGRVLAMQEAVTLLAFLLRDLKFQCVKDYKLEPTLSSFVQKPVDDLPMVIKPRDE